MENKVSQFNEFKRYYLSEFELYDSEEFVTFNIAGIDVAKNEIQIAITLGGVNVIGKGKLEHVIFNCSFDYTELLSEIFSRFVSPCAQDFKYGLSSFRYRHIRFLPTFSYFLPAFYKPNSKVPCDFEKYFFNFSRNKKLRRTDFQLRKSIRWILSFLRFNLD